jgi:hypothetical protein
MLKIGIYLNSQFPDTDDPASRLADLVQQVTLAESLGFDSIWAGEHHLTAGFHFLPQLPLLSYLAPRAGQLTLGTNLLLLPMHRPVDVAEQVAFIDIACASARPTWGACSRSTVMRTRRKRAAARPRISWPSTRPTPRGA